MANNYEPVGTKFAAAMGEMMLISDDEPRESLRGWIVYRHVEGQWVTLRKASEHERATILAAIDGAAAPAERGQ